MSNPFDQSDFIMSVYGKTSKELHTVLTQSIDEMIEYFRKMYLTTNDFDQLPSQFELCKSKGYGFVTKINLCLDLLSVIEDNETKRLMYTGCLVHVLNEGIFTGDIELAYRQYFVNERSNISEYTSVLQRNYTDLSKKYWDDVDTIKNIDKNAIILKFNQGINMCITKLIKIKTILSKESSSRVMY